MVTIQLERRSPAGASRTSLEPRLEAHRPELRRHCQRMLRSSFEADDAVQETLVRAWRRYDQFDGRASLRSWLYRIATNVCLDMLRGRKRRARPVDLAPGRPEAQAEAGLERVDPGALVTGPGSPAPGDPADVVADREAVREAFLVALQRLPCRQRSVLILREVLRWRADEVADLLGCSTAAVNSALQRARTALAADTPEVCEPDGEAQSRLLAGYVDALARSDVSSLVSLARLDHHGGVEAA